MYTDFYGYSLYSGAISEHFVTNIDDNIKYDNVYNYSSRKEKICS